MGSFLHRGESASALPHRLVTKSLWLSNIWIRFSRARWFGSAAGRTEWYSVLPACFPGAHAPVGCARQMRSASTAGARLGGGGWTEYHSVLPAPSPEFGRGGRTEYHSVLPAASPDGHEVVVVEQHVDQVLARPLVWLGGRRDRAGRPRRERRQLRPVSQQDGLVGQELCARRLFRGR